MKDDRSDADVDDGDDGTEEDILDRLDEPVIAADATGMLANEKYITDAEIEEGLENGEAEP